MTSKTPKHEWTARVAKWNEEKVYGWLQWGNKRVFLHRRDLSGTGRTPTVGEQARFIPGQDAEGRPCAANVILPCCSTSDRDRLSLVLMGA